MLKFLNKDSDILDMSYFLIVHSIDPDLFITLWAYKHIVLHLNLKMYSININYTSKYNVE